jgi:hypothetical protein
MAKQDNLDSKQEDSLETPKKPEIPSFYRWVVVSTWGRGGQDKPLFMAYMKDRDEQIKFVDITGNNAREIDDIKKGVLGRDGKECDASDGRTFLAALRTHYTNSQRVSATRVESGSNLPAEFTQ